GAQDPVGADGGRNGEIVRRRLPVVSPSIGGSRGPAFHRAGGYRGRRPAVTVGPPIRSGLPARPQEHPMDTTPDLPRLDPVRLADETFLVPNLFPAGDGLFVPVNSMVIRGAEPVIVDTGAPVHRELWLDQVFSLVEPEDVRWVFLSHDDGDHTGALLDVLERCPNATLVTNMFSVERLALDTVDLPLERMRWLDE